MKYSLIRKLEKYKYVSFDMFDTLITRNIISPEYLFNIVEVSYNKKNPNCKISDWLKLRKDGEYRARKNSIEEEITLDDIYKNINLPKIILNKLKREEISLEIAVSTRNNDFFDIYNYCLKNNKKIIITSDMYLDREIIEKILKNNGIIYDKVYVSSEIGCTKSTGYLFSYILKDLNIKYDEIIHIGDNKKSDFISPRRLRINSILYKNKNIEDKNREFIYNYMQLFIKNNILNSYSYYWKTGYKTLGPLLLGFSKWLDNELKKEKFDRIFFLSRDGYLIQQSYNIINKDNKSDYLYVSRRAVIVPTIWMYEDFNEIFNNISLPRELNLKILGDKLGISEELIVKVSKKLNINCDEYFYSENLIVTKYYKVIKYLKKEIINNSKIEYNNLINYFKYKNFSGKVAIIDIGWNGNIQYALNKIASTMKNIEIIGFYFGVNPDSNKPKYLKMKSYLFDKNDPDLFYLKKYFNTLFELFFLGNHGSVKRYINKRNYIEMYDYEYETNDTKIAIKDLQYGALQFVSDSRNNEVFNLFAINKYDAISNLIKLGNNPSKEDILKLGKLNFFDGEIHKMVNLKSRLYYFIHPICLKKDFEKSIWKTAFLKKIFVLDLDFYKIVSFTDKIYHKKRGDMMKINIYLPEIYRGIAGGYKIIYQYANFLSKSNDVCIYYNLNNGKNSKNIPPKLCVFYRRLLFINYPYWFKLNKNIKQKCILNISDDNIRDADISIATAAITANDVAGLSIKKGKKIYFIQDFENWGSTSDDFLYKSYSLGLNNVVISKWLKTIVDEHSKKESILLRNGIDIDKFKIYNDIKNRDNHSIAMLYHNRLNKGCKEGLEVLYRLKKDYPDIKVTLFGSPKKPKSLPTWIRYIRNASEDEVIDILNNSAIYLCTSKSEGFGLPGLESMACGCALITTNCLGVLEYANNSNSLISDRDDYEDLYNNIKLLFDNSTKRIKLAKKGNKDVQDFSLKKSMKLMEELIQRVNFYEDK